LAAIKLFSMKLHYHIVDVFTDRPFAGNPLAVFTEGRTVPESAMQAIAKELNLSETTFVLPPSDPANNCRVRIFTPTAELPMAGHPTIGTAFVLAREGLIASTDSPTSARFEEGVGVIPISIRYREGAPEFIEMNQPLPQFGPPLDCVDSVAEMLSLSPDRIRSTGLPIQTVSCGVPFLFVPIDTLASVQRVRFRVDVWEKIQDIIRTPNVFIFTREVEFNGSGVHSRMFAPGLGVVEDPATGGASGPLGCYLLRHRVIDSNGELQCVSEQGIEMGRPSFISIRISHTGEEITAVGVGGTCHYMGQGYLEDPTPR
jgi:trans-2,3-dihydro-3-hydroxyanthranilate isomerase